MSRIPDFLATLGAVIRNLCRMILLGAIIAGGILIGIDLVKFMVQSSDLTVKEITVAGNKRIDHEAIRAMAGITPGTNIWLVDLDELRTRLESHPKIKHAVTQRIPPHRVHIVIEEREPIVFILNPEDGMLYGLDAEGVMLPPIMGKEYVKLSPSERKNNIDLVSAKPLMNGDLSVSFEPGAKIENGKILQSLHLLWKLQIMAPGMFSELSETEWQREGNLVLHLRRRIGVLVLRNLVSPDLERKIEAFWSVLERENLRAIYVDARFPEKGFAVRWDLSDGPRWKKLYRSEGAYITSAERVER